MKNKKKNNPKAQKRLANGLIEEVKGLLEKGISEENLLYYGLEYKFITQYIKGKLTI